MDNLAVNQADKPAITRPQTRHLIPCTPGNANRNPNGNKGAIFGRIQSYIVDNITVPEHAVLRKEFVPSIAYIVLGIRDNKQVKAETRFQAAKYLADLHLNRDNLSVPDLISGDLEAIFTQIKVRRRKATPQDNVIDIDKVSDIK